MARYLTFQLYGMLAAYPIDARLVPAPWKRPAKTLVYADEDVRLSSKAPLFLVRDQAIRHDRRQFAERRVAMAEIPAATIGKTEAGHVPQ